MPLYDPNSHTSDVPFVFVYKCQLDTIRQVEFSATYYPDSWITLDLLKKLLADDLKFVRSSAGAFDHLDNDGLEFLIYHFDALVPQDQIHIVLDDLFTTENLLSEELKIYLAVKTGQSAERDRMPRNRFQYNLPFRVMR